MERIIAEFLGEPKKIDEDLRRYRKDIDFVSVNHDQLLNRYPERWIAVIDQKVVADCENVNGLMETVLAQDLERAGIDISFMTENPPTLILAAG